MLDPTYNFVSADVSLLLTTGIKIVSIFLGALIIKKIALVIIEKIIRRAIVPNDHLSILGEKRREDTLIRIFHTVVIIFILIIAVMMALSEIGFDTAPLLASAGIAGIALGFGAQYLIKDLINGFFIILENQYRVGDTVCFDNTCGKVEDISLRITRLRDTDGTVHHVPNGAIQIASNMTKNFATINMNIGIAYDSDIEKVIKVINTTGEQLANDPEWKSRIRSAPQFKRIDDFADSAIIVKIIGESQPLDRLDVAGELRKRLKLAFDQSGIEMPYPHQVVEIKKG